MAYNKTELSHHVLWLQDALHRHAIKLGTQAGYAFYELGRVWQQLTKSGPVNRFKVAILRS
ncbi:MAG: hypothetical protein KUG81_07035 [Gammaproteobacteria bacterium]|nr:hypothetical protein [Gammaproteobacteria bacterium]